MEYYRNGRRSYICRLKIFIEYGILTDEKFAEKAAGFMLWKNTEGKYFTAEEYREFVKGLPVKLGGTTE